MTEENCNTCNKKNKKKKACKINGKKSKENRTISLYVCEDCSKQSIRAEGVCSPKAVAPSFVCKKCGSPGVQKKSLCKPRAVKS